MKNKELHKFIEDFNIEGPHTPKHHAELKRAVLMAQPTQQSTIARLKDTLLINKGNTMKRKKLLASTGFALFAVFAVSAIVLTQVTHAPRAMAASLANKGIASLKQFDASDLEQLRSQFSGDPEAALVEAKNAKDLTTITKDQYSQLLKDARTVVTTNKTEQLPGGGSATSGTIASTTPQGQTSTVEMGSVSVGASAVPAEGTPPAGTEVIVGQPASTTASGSSIISSSAAVDPGALKPISNVDTMTAAKYITYTNTDGNTVVIGFDANDSPLFKSVFQK